MLVPRLWRVKGVEQGVTRRLGGCHFEWAACVTDELAILPEKKEIL